MVMLGHSRVTIEFAGTGLASPEAEAGPQPFMHRDIRLVETRADERSTYCLHEGKETYTLTEKETEQLLNLLARMEISAPWKALFGFDGGTYELALNSGMSGASFSWWVSPPPEWKGVGEVFNYVWGLAQQHSS
jgi:hypothetical protein